MPEGDVSSLTRVSKTLSLPGYVLNKDVLTRVDEIARRAVGGSDKDPALHFACLVSVHDKGETLQFASLHSFLDHFDKERTPIKAMEIQYQVEHKTGVSIAFGSDGNIELSAYSDQIDFQFNVDRLERELRVCGEDYYWPVRSLVFSRVPFKLMVSAVVGLSVYILLNMGFYWQALRIGVDIDPALIHQGNTYYQAVERAIKSDSTTTKLDVLLRGQLRYFVNVSDFLVVRQRHIIFSLMAMAVLVVGILLLRQFRKIHPLSFFAIGRQKDLLTRYQRQREIWGIAVIIAFAVNLVAGAVVALVLN